MKLFCLLLAFYTIGIAIAPCNHVHDHSEAAAITVSGAQDHHDEKNDICSPFCICACCQTVASVVNFYHSHLASPVASSVFSSPAKDFISAPFFAIWQPPKLVNDFLKFCYGGFRM